MGSFESGLEQIITQVDNVANAVLHPNFNPQNNSKQFIPNDKQVIYKPVINRLFGTHLKVGYNNLLMDLTDDV